MGPNTFTFDDDTKNISPASSKLNAFNINANFENSSQTSGSLRNSQKSNPKIPAENQHLILNLNDTTHSRNTDVSEMIESVKVTYNQQMLASTKALESQYLSIISDLKKKLKTEKKDMEINYLEKISKLKETLNKNKVSQGQLQKLDRELLANVNLLKETKAELNLKSRELDKYVAVKKSLEQNVSELKGELDGAETELIEARKVFRVEECKSKSATAKYNSLEEVINHLTEKNKSMKAEFDRKEKENQKEFSDQFQEMQEDMALLCERIHQMSTIKDQHESLQTEHSKLTKENTELISNNNSLIDEMKALGSKLAESLGKNEENETSLNQLKKELKDKDSQKWILETTNARLEQNLSDSRCEQLDLTRQLEKKEKISGKLGQEIISAENGVNEAKKECHKLNNDLKNLRLENDRLTDFNHQLNDEIESIKSQQSELNRKFEAACSEQEAEIKRLKADLELKSAELDRKNKKIQSHLENFESTEVNVCQLKIKLKQLEEDKNELVNQRRGIENNLLGMTSLKEKAEHNLDRQMRKFDFLQDELEQYKSQYDKERNKFESTVRDNISMTDQIASLRSIVDNLTSELKEANSKNNKTTDRMKDKIKLYHKNISNVHGQEVNNLQDTIRTLELKLKEQEIKWLEKQNQAHKENLNGLIDTTATIAPPPQPIIIQNSKGLSASEKKKMKELENKINEMTSSTINDKIVLDQLDTKVKSLEAEKKILMKQKQIQSQHQSQNVSHNQCQKLGNISEIETSQENVGKRPEILSSSPKKSVTDRRSSGCSSSSSKKSTAESHFLSPLKENLNKKPKLDKTPPPALPKKNKSNDHKFLKPATPKAKFNKIDQIMAKHAMSKTLAQNKSNKVIQRTPLAVRKTDERNLPSINKISGNKMGNDIEKANFSKPQDATNKNYKKQPPQNPPKNIKNDLNKSEGVDLGRTTRSKRNLNRTAMV